MKTAITVITLAVSSPIAAQVPVEWPVAAGGNGHWYVLQAQPNGRFWELVSRAEAQGGHLVSITSATENEFVRALSMGHNVHFGAFHDQGAPGFSEPASGWTWVSGEPWTWSGWCSNQPDDASWGGYQGQEVARFNTSTATCWDDAHSLVQLESIAIEATVIEWSADCNGDGAIDFGQIQAGVLADFDGNNIPDCCASPGREPPFPIVQWTVTAGGNGHYYAGVQLPADVTPANWWDEAQARCEALGGHLATPTSSSENSFIISQAVSQIPPVSGLGRGPMIGGRREGGVWRWITGEPWTFTGWCGPEPTGDGNNLQYWAFSALCWNDFPGTVAYSNTYIIEWSADCNGDGLVDFGQILDGTIIDQDGNWIPDDCDIPPCSADVTGNGVVDGGDLGLLISAWGEVTNSTANLDFDLDGDIGCIDLAHLLAQWGTCSP